MSKGIPAQNVRLKRVYEQPASTDGTRVLVDRLWPRGLSKADAAVDWWARDLAPSTALRQWFGHEATRWPEFRRRYAAEVAQHRDEFDQLRELARKGTVTLLYAARDEAHNDAVALRDMLLGKLRGEKA